MLPNYLPLIGDRDHEEGAGRVKVKGLRLWHGRPEVHGFSVSPRYKVHESALQLRVDASGRLASSSSLSEFSLRVAVPFGISKGAPQPLRKTASPTVEGASARQAA
ncbi:hypothetical protein LTR84_008029 [Exophiala bonariae]|uniref:Uncharacterized protein n=1 Tax=Exophiala bonariae TaxID=1690606 RepID=A0AAV9NQT8_9EURO|nr:hypothetical protein LTR84_008029 [Exophiala bonariae]